MKIFYGLLYSGNNRLPWDQPERQGLVDFRSEGAGVSVILGDQRLGYLSPDYASGLQSGREIALSASQRLRLFSSAQGAERWLRWGQREKLRWEEELHLLLSDTGRL